MLGMGYLANFPDEIWSIGVMECWKWVHPVGERDPLLQLSITPVLQMLPIDFYEFQLRHLGSVFCYVPSGLVSPLPLNLGLHPRLSCHAPLGLSNLVFYPSSDSIGL